MKKRQKTKIKLLTDEEMIGNFVYELPQNLRTAMGDIEDVMNDHHALLLASEYQFMAGVIKRMSRESLIVANAFEAIGLETPYERKRKAEAAKFQNPRLQEIADQKRAEAMTAIPKRKAR